MNYRCKFCGYRFKDKDETICPECLTAREEDISCGVFGENEHSHAVFDERYYNGSTGRNDTFRDGRADFLKEERREENRVDAARYERRNGGDINMEADHAKRFSRPAQPYNATRPTPSYNTAQQTGQPQKKGKGCGCIVTIIILIIIVHNIFPDALQKLSEIIDNEINGNSSSQTSVEASSENTKPGGTVVDRSADCDIDFYMESVEETLGDTEDEGLNVFTKENLWFYNDKGETINCKDIETTQIYQAEFNFTVCHKDYSRVETDEIKIVSVKMLAYDENDEMISSYDGYVNDLTVYSIGKCSSMYPKMYYQADAAHCELDITTEIDGKEVIYTYKLK